MQEEHPAQRAGRLSAQYVNQGQREGWLDLFAENAVVQDPVGESPLDPSGQGHRGRQAIAAFWDMVIASGDIHFEIRQSHPCGSYWCANEARLSNRIGGQEISIELVVVYEVDGQGKIASLKAYWDYRQVEKALSPQSGQAA